MFPPPSNLTKKSIFLRAPVFTNSGYGQHSRAIARYLLDRFDSEYKIKVQALPWGQTSWILDKQRDNGLLGKLFDRCVAGPEPSDISVQLQLPNEWDPSIARINIGITAAVETDICNPQWIDACNRMTAVIVPSEHTKKTLCSSGNLSVPIHVVPENFFDACLNPETKPIDIELDFDTPKNFLIFGQLTGNNPYNDRKNIFLTLKWLCDVFAAREDIGIVIKTNCGKNTKIDRHICTNTLTSILNEARQGRKVPHVHLVHGDMTDDELINLYRHPKIMAYVNAARGEGFCVPMIEAAANGLPIIATNWSGHLDFMNKGKFIKLDYDLKQIHESRVDNQIFLPHSKWAEVREDDFKKKVQRFMEKPDMPKQWAKELKEIILKTYSFEAIAKNYDEVLMPYINRA